MLFQIKKNDQYCLFSRFHEFFNLRQEKCWISETRQYLNNNTDIRGQNYHWIIISPRHPDPCTTSPTWGSSPSRTCWRREREMEERGERICQLFDSHVSMIQENSSLMTSSSFSSILGIFEQVSQFCPGWPEYPLEQSLDCSASLIHHPGDQGHGGDDDDSLEECPPRHHCRMLCEDLSETSPSHCAGSDPVKQNYTGNIFSK